MIELANKRFCIFGLQGSGKTTLAKYILRQFYDTGWVIDVLDEYAGFNRYVMQDRTITGRDELNAAIFYILEKFKPRLLIIDEANRYCPPKKPLPEAVSYLNDFHRHENLAIGFIARRPAQLHTDLVELAHYLFIFRLVGKNDKTYLDYLHSGLSEAVESLPPHSFIFYNRENGEIRVMKVPLTK
ncbi:helicase HerA domain-containing protein [Geoglobus ahangari]